MCVDFLAMITDEIPQPYHRWAANEDADVQAFSLKDRCLSCRVQRNNPMAGISTVESNAVAAGQCPGRIWLDLDDFELRPYLLAYVDKPTTPAERTIYASLHSKNDGEGEGEK
jgi:hypothetical protein